jgi:sortase (surface protein transpeptidase)
MSKEANETIDSWQRHFAKAIDLVTTLHEQFEAYRRAKEIEHRKLTQKIRHLEAKLSAQRPKSKRTLPISYAENSSSSEYESPAKRPFVGRVSMPKVTMMPIQSVDLLPFVLKSAQQKRARE